MNDQARKRGAFLLLALGFLLGVPARPSWAGTVVAVTPYSSNWQGIYAGFAEQDSFGSTTLAPGLSVTLQGGAFPSAQTYTSLPQLLDPTQVSSVGGFGGPFLNNTWGGASMLTNYGYVAGLPSGQNWTNGWAPTVTDSAQEITFNFSQGVTSVGIGLSNFQSTNPPSPVAPMTNHLLLINGVALPQDLESLAGSNWTSGLDVRNGYLTVTATDGELIHSIGFYDIDTSGGVYDGLNFGALGFTPLAVPESSGLILLGFGVLGMLMLLRWWPRPAGLSRRRPTPETSAVID